MASTPLHAALGDPSVKLTFDLIQRACEEGIRETTSLDWKQQLPLTAGPDDRAARERQHLELAKDVAAMANSGGGMIVFGIAEVRGEGNSAAGSVVPVGRVDDKTARAIRQVASNLIYPPVVGLELTPLAPGDSDTEGVLVLTVPDSVDTPHLILTKDGEWFRAPYRHGPDTAWMVERQIAAAYRDREQSRRQRQVEFAERFAAFASACSGRAGDPWVVIMAAPDLPLRDVRALQLPQANRIIDTAWRWPWPARLGPRDLTQASPTKRGLRRHLREDSRPVTRLNATPRARVEVHGDGAIAVAFTRDGAFPDGHRGQMAIADIEQTCLDFFALLWETRASLAVSGDYTARISVTPTTQLFRRMDAVVDDFQPFHESHRIVGFADIDGPITTDGGLEGALHSWIDLVHDAVNQAGVSSSVDADALLTALNLAD